MASSRYTPGIHAALRLLKSHPERVRRVLIDARGQNPRLGDLRRLAEAAAVEVESTARHRLDALSGGARHQGVIVDLAPRQGWDDAALRAYVEAELTAGRELLLLLLDQVQDPHNLGACLRTAEAAGVDAVIVPQKGSAGLTPSARKIASGAAEILRFVQVADAAKTLEWMRGYGIRIVATADGAAETLYSADLSGSLCLILGGEERGVSRRLRERSDAEIAIPMAGQVESLNVSVAAGVCLYEVVRRRLASARRVR